MANRTLQRVAINEAKSIKNEENIVNIKQDIDAIDEVNLKTKEEIENLKSKDLLQDSVISQNSDEIRKIVAQQQNDDEDTNPNLIQINNVPELNVSDDPTGELINDIPENRGIYILINPSLSKQSLVPNQIRLDINTENDRNANTEIYILTGGIVQTITNFILDQGRQKYFRFIKEPVDYSTEVGGIIKLEKVFVYETDAEENQRIDNLENKTRYQTSLITNETLLTGTVKVEIEVEIGGKKIKEAVDTLETEVILLHGEQVEQATRINAVEEQVDNLTEKIGVTSLLKLSGVTPKVISNVAERIEFTVEQEDPNGKFIYDTNTKLTSLTTIGSALANTKQEYLINTLNNGDAKIRIYLTDENDVIIKELTSTSGITIPKNITGYPILISYNTNLQLGETIQRAVVIVDTNNSGASYTRINNDYLSTGTGKIDARDILTLPQNGVTENNVQTQLETLSLAKTVGGIDLNATVDANYIAYVTAFVNGPAEVQAGFAYQTVAYYGEIVTKQQRLITLKLGDIEADREFTRQLTLESTWTEWVEILKEDTIYNYTEIPNHSYIESRDKIVNFTTLTNSRPWVKIAQCADAGSESVLIDYFTGEDYGNNARRVGTIAVSSRLGGTVGSHNISVQYGDNRTNWAIFSYRLVGQIIEVWAKFNAGYPTSFNFGAKFVHGTSTPVQLDNLAKDSHYGLLESTQTEPTGLTEMQPWINGTQVLFDGSGGRTKGSIVTFSRDVEQDEYIEIIYGRDGNDAYNGIQSTGRISVATMFKGVNTNDIRMLNMGSHRDNMITEFEGNNYYTVQSLFKLTSQSTIEKISRDWTVETRDNGVVDSGFWEERYQIFKVIVSK